MKESLKFLNRISKIKGFEPENYYVINIYPDYIILQGYYNSKLTLILKKYMTVFEIDLNGYIEFKRGRLEIILTDK